MFRILITSAVYTWHFVYLTVLFFFSAIFLLWWLLLAEWSTASHRRQMTEWWDSEGGGEEEEEEEEKSRPLRRRWTHSLSSPVCGGRSVTRGSTRAFHPPSVVGWLQVGGRPGRCLFSAVAFDGPSGPAPPSLILQVKARTRMSLCFHKATRAKASRVAQHSGLPTCCDGKSHNYLWLYRGGMKGLGGGCRGGWRLRRMKRRISAGEWN